MLIASSLSTYLPSVPVPYDHVQCKYDRDQGASTISVFALLYLHLGAFVDTHTREMKMRDDRMGSSSSGCERPVSLGSFVVSYFNPRAASDRTVRYRYDRGHWSKYVSVSALQLPFFVGILNYLLTRRHSRDGETSTCSSCPHVLFEMGIVARNAYVVLFSSLLVLS
jgi:hypothetical protein